MSYISCFSSSFSQTTRTGQNSYTEVQNLENFQKANRYFHHFYSQRTHFLYFTLWVQNLQSSLHVPLSMLQIAHKKISFFLLSFTLINYLFFYKIILIINWACLKKSILAPSKSTKSRYFKAFFGTKMMYIAYSLCWYQI